MIKKAFSKITIWANLMKKANKLWEAKVPARGLRKKKKIRLIGPAKNGMTGGNKKEGMIKIC